jgi:hypothetical protein
MMPEIDQEMQRRLDAMGHLERAARMYARREADARLRRYRNQALVGFLILLFGIGYVLHDLHATSQQARGVVCQIITRGDKQAYVYRHEGLINAKQLHRALIQSAEDRKLLAANCDTGLTPPPKAATPGPHGRAGGR